LQYCCERLEYRPLFGGKDFCLSNREFRRHKYPAVGKRICRCEQQETRHYLNRDLRSTRTSPAWTMMHDISGDGKEK
ncbi:MAG TPA: hypothetical protein VFM05_09120, partial [Candidatus Saccharimonadales bacterium]|nr:hypothetical protein [Candidatus Saccharimonadales bacterium]